MLSGMLPLLRARALICAVAGFALLLSVIALGAYDRSVVEYVYFPAAILLILSSFGWDRLQRPNLIFAAMALAPFGTFMLANFYHSETFGLERRVESDPYFWLEYGATSALLILGVLSARNLHLAAKWAFPIGLAALFALLTWHKFDATNPHACRVYAYLGTPFMSPLAFSSVALLYFALAPRLGRFAMIASSGFLVAAVVVTLGYTAARGIFAGLLVGLMMTALALLLYREGRWLLRTGVVVLALCAGAVISAVVDTALDCDGVLRFKAIMQPELDPSLEPSGVALIEAQDEAVPVTPAPDPEPVPVPEPAPEASPSPPPATAPTTEAPVETAPEPAPAVAPPEPPEVHNAVTLRVLMWETALEQVAERPWLGSGRLAEIARIQPSGHDHAHQQYLSWMIWFGVPGLIAGCLGLFAPAVALRLVRSWQERLLLLAATCSVLPVSLLFDTLLRLKQFIVFQLLFSVVAYVIIKEIYREAEPSERPGSDQA